MGRNEGSLTINITNDVTETKFSIGFTYGLHRTL